MNRRTKRLIRFWKTVSKTVRPMLSDRCLSCLSVCLPVCDIGVLWPVSLLAASIHTPVILGLLACRGWCPRRRYWAVMQQQLQLRVSSSSREFVICRRQVNIKTLAELYYISLPWLIPLSVSDGLGWHRIGPGPHSHLVENTGIDPVTSPGLARPVTAGSFIHCFWAHNYYTVVATPVVNWNACCFMFKCC